MIIYFSGTGNSRYVAEALADQLQDEVISSNEMIKRNNQEHFESESPFIFVFPIYVSAIAKIFSDFLRGSNFSGNKKAYFVATCAGKASGSVPNNAIKICREKGLQYMGTAVVQMPQNYIVYFRMTEPDECKRRVEAAVPIIKQLANKVRCNMAFSEKPASKVEFIATTFVEKIYYGPCTVTKSFYATEECIGCGLCETVCPLNNIKIENHKPKWIKSCVHCMACINKCPKYAIEYGKKTIGKNRYVCEKYERGTK